MYESGIYIIKNKLNNKVYVGQSVNLNRRIADHRRHLQNGSHKNTYLQRAFSCDGAENFEFDIIEHCSKEELNDREIYWISQYKSNNRAYGYNIESGGQLGNTWSDDAKERRSGDGNPMYGKHQSPEMIEHIRIANRGSSDKLTEDDVRHMKYTLATTDKSLLDIAKEYNVDVTTVSKIRRCENWSWVEPQFNDILMDLWDSREIEFSARDADIVYWFDSGVMISDLAKHFGYSKSYVHSIISKYRKEELQDKAAERRKKHDELVAGVRSDFMAGISKEDIMKKYNIQSTQYVKWTTDLYNQKKQALISKCKELRASGMMVKDIATQLGLHRTTVTEYCKVS